MLISVALSLLGLVALITVVTPKVEVITAVLLVKVTFVIKLVVKLGLEVGFVIFGVVVITIVVVIARLKTIVDPLMP